MGDITYKPQLIIEGLQHPDRFGMYFRIGRTNDKKQVVEVAKPLEFKPYVPGMALADLANCFELEPREAEEIMDALWRCGCRPEGLRDYLGEMDRHIKTLKDIVQFLMEHDRFETTKEVTDAIKGRLKQDEAFWKDVFKTHVKVDLPAIGE